MSALTLSEYRGSDLRSEEMIAGRLGYVHDLFLTHDFEVVDRLPPGAGDVVAILDNKERAAKLERLAVHEGRVVVVTAGGDGAFSADLLPGGELPENVVALFTINGEVDDPRVVNLPLGVRVERAGLFRQALSPAGGERDGLLYANFGAGPLYPRRDGRPHMRHRLVERFGDTPWVDLRTAEGAGRSDESRLAYYAAMARHEFALSPEGFGADCYRHWECLYLGTIPIVRRSPAMSSFGDLPILFTDDYEEIDRPYLEEQRQRFAARRFEIERLTASFYRALFRKRVATLSSPRFLCWGFQGTDDEAFLDRLARAQAELAQR